MALPFYNWSRTAASNANADSTVNWAEGQAPSSVNDSGRAMMASTAAFRDDIAGAIVTAGTSTAYTVTSYQIFDTLSHLNGQIIAFTPHTTNGSTVTLNVDGLGAKPLRSAPSTELVGGTLIQGTPYAAIYNNTDGAFYLHGFFSNPYSIPLAAGIDFWGATAPNSAFAFAYGQAISRTTYSALFSLVGTTYGTGDGSTTFNLPDKRGRVSAGVDNMGGSAASRLTSASGMGAGGPGQVGGTETHTLVTANLPPYTPSGSVSTSVTTTVVDLRLSTGNSPLSTSISPGSSTSGSFGSSTTPVTSVASSSFTGNTQGGTSTPVNGIQPTIVCNYIIRII
ncbi:phage tail protein [Bradyrhizobium sp. 8-10B]|uniref:phage tail protein n=1 Tax=Bradyrhizobium sp. 8-10B TaxID=3344579 RepID=UPI0035BF294C